MTQNTVLEVVMKFQVDTIRISTIFKRFLMILRVLTPRYPQLFRVKDDIFRICKAEVVCHDPAREIEF